MNKLFSIGEKCKKGEASVTHPKIAVLHNSFDAMGGAERVTATLIEALNDVGICPAVHTIAPIPEDYLCSFYCKKLHYKLAATFPLKINTLNIYQKVLTNLLSFKLAKYDVVISIGRFSPEKRQLKQLEIAKCLPETTFRICGSVVMPYNWQWFQYIKSKVEEMELKNVELHPNLPFKKLVKLIGESKIFIHTMLYEDFGLTTCEAIAGGCIPCVINSGGQKEIVPFKNLRFHTLKEATKIIKKINEAQESNLVRLKSKLFNFTKRFDESVFKKEMLQLIFKVNHGRN